MARRHPPRPTLSVRTGEARLAVQLRPLLLEQALAVAGLFSDPAIAQAGQNAPRIARAVNALTAAHVSLPEAKSDRAVLPVAPAGRPAPVMLRWLAEADELALFCEAGGHLPPIS